MTLNVTRLSALARKYMTDTLDVRRTTGRGTAVTTSTVISAASYYRLPTSALTVIGQAGADTLSRFKFVIDTSTDLLPGDVLVAGGLQYRVLSAGRTLPGLCVEATATVVQ